jgi:FG-GAP repeat
MRARHPGNGRFRAWGQCGMVRFAGTVGLLAVSMALSLPPAAATAALPAVSGRPSAARPPGTDVIAAGKSVLSRPGDWFGWSVAVSGPVAVVGAIGVHNLSGAAYVFARSARGWHPQTTLFNPGGTGGEFGNAVAVSGTTVVVGAWGNNGGRGVVYVYVRSGRTWRRQARIAGTEAPGCSTCGAGDFGESVAISGNMMVIGEPYTHNFRGATFIYVRSANGKWHLQAKLTGPAFGSYTEEFGGSVAVSGTTVVIGAVQARKNRGEVFIYTRTGRSWHRQATLVGSPGSLFGASVVISGATIGVGAFSTNRNSARGYVFAHSGSGWRRQASLTTPPGKVSDSRYFTSVAISGSRVLIGDPKPNPHRCGAAYEYARSGTSWRERAKLINPGCAPDDQFGAALALSGRTALIGAYGYHGQAGAAYVQTVP